MKLLLFDILFRLAGWTDGRTELIIMLSQLSTKLKLKLKLSLAIDFEVCDFVYLIGNEFKEHIVKGYQNCVEFVIFVNSNIEYEVTSRNIDLQNMVQNYKFYQDDFLFVMSFHWQMKQLHNIQQCVQKFLFLNKHF